MTGASRIDFSYGFDTIVSNDEITVIKRDRGAAVARDDLDLVPHLQIVIRIFNGQMAVFFI